MNTREHHVAGQAPDYSRPAQAFRHFDRRRADWRGHRPGWEPFRPAFRQRMRSFLRRAGQWALNQIHPDPRERAVIYAYLLIATWIVMIAIGVMAYHGIHPWRGPRP